MSSHYGSFDTDVVEEEPSAARAEEAYSVAAVLGVSAVSTRSVVVLMALLGCAMFGVGMHSTMQARDAQALDRIVMFPEAEPAARRAEESDDDRHHAPHRHKRRRRAGEGGESNDVDEESNDVATRTATVGGALMASFVSGAGRCRMRVADDTGAIADSVDMTFGDGTMVKLTVGIEATGEACAQACQESKQCAAFGTDTKWAPGRCVYYSGGPYYGAPATSTTATCYIKHRLHERALPPSTIKAVRPTAAAAPAAAAALPASASDELLELAEQDASIAAGATKQLGISSSQKLLDYALADAAMELESSALAEENTAAEKPTIVAARGDRADQARADINVMAARP